MNKHIKKQFRFIIAGFMFSLGYGILSFIQNWMVDSESLIDAVDSFVKTTESDFFGIVLFLGSILFMVTLVYYLIGLLVYLIYKIEFEEELQTKPKPFKKTERK